MDIILYASFKNATTTLGETGLVPTVTAWSVLKVSPYTKTEVVSAQNATEIGRGLYLYVITSANLETHDYPAVALTNGTPADVIDAEVHMLRWDGAEVYATQLGYLTADVATEAKQDIIDTTVDAILVDTGTTIPATLTDISGATFNTSTDSLEAVRNRGDIAWITGGSSSLTAEDVWTYAQRTLTMSTEEILAIQAGSDIAVLRGDTLSVAITGLGDITDADKLYLTVRKVKSVGDDESAIQVEKTAKLLYLNGAAPVSPIVNTDADLTVDDATDGDITFTMKAVASTELRSNSYYYDVEKITVAGDVTTLRIGAFAVELDVTRAVT